MVKKALIISNRVTIKPSCHLELYPIAHDGRRGTAQNTDKADIMSTGLFVFTWNGTRLDDFFSTASQEAPHYARFSIALRGDKAKPLHTIITNACGCGRFIYDENTGTYRQTRGTCQYQIPGTSHGIRKALKAELKEALTHKRDFTIDGLTETEAQILDVLEGK